MQIILINHAERDRESGKDDRDQPLHPEKGVKQADDLVARLREQKVTRTLYLTSKNVHTKETAERVCAALGGVPDANVVEIDALTPGHRTESCQDILEQARASGHDPESHGVVVIVGHFPRLNQLFAYLTWRTAAPTRLDYGQEVYLTINAFWDGNGQGQWPGSSS
jgi:phosphohistidine phosphatase SixA